MRSRGITLSSTLAALYGSLAEALAIDVAWPAWLCLPGRNWPLWEPATELAALHKRRDLSHAVTCLSEVPASSRANRQAAYETRLKADGRTPIPLHESIHRSGRLLGPEMFSVQAEYKRAGLEVHGAELPDHAAVELEFLSFLAEQEARGGELARKWYRTRRRFLRDHTSRWLPDVGHQLTTVNDPAWQAIGLLLSAMSTSPETKSVTKEPLGLPQVEQDEQCSLCGFCAQVCPTGALSMVEDARSTRLTLYPDLCTHCQKCVRICEEGLLKMNGHPEEVQIMTLKWSERAACPKCGSPTISQAELAAVINRLGEHPLWLDYCLECRSLQA